MVFRVRPTASSASGDDDSKKRDGGLGDEESELLSSLLARMASGYDNHNRRSAEEELTRSLITCRSTRRVVKPLCLCLRGKATAMSWMSTLQPKESDCSGEELFSRL